MEWLRLLAPLAIGIVVSYTLIELIGRSSLNRDSSGSADLRVGVRSINSDQQQLKTS